jgi:hypothetical protein
MRRPIAFVVIPAEAGIQEKLDAGVHRHDGRMMDTY